MNVMNELRELDAWLEGREDIDNEGGPNVAMHVRQLLAEAIPALDALILEADSALSCMDACGDWPATADDFRAALARVQGGAE